jgi:hypothetical protein
MNDLDDPRVKNVLSRARRSWSPSAADLERVRRGVDAAVAAGMAGVPAVAPRTPSWMGRVLMTAAFTVAGAGAGYWAGRRAERRPLPPAQAVASSPRVLPPAARVPATPPPPPVAAAGEPPAPSRARRIEKARQAPLATATADTPAESLVAEVRALRNTERALRDGNPGLALAFLDELDRIVPGGQMREERTALRSIARCNAGQQPFGVSLADEFSATYAASAYRARVEQACRGTDSHSSGD